MEIKRELNRTETESKKKSYSTPMLEEIGSVGGHTKGNATSGPLADNSLYYNNAPSQPENR